MIEKDILFASELRPVEKAKIACGAQNFEALSHSINFANADTFERFSNLIE